MLWRSARTLTGSKGGFLYVSRAFMLLVFGEGDKRLVGRAWVLPRGGAGGFLSTFATKGAGFGWRITGGGFDVNLATTL